MAQALAIVQNINPYSGTAKTVVGTILDKRFVVLEEVGQDGAGVRYLAYDMTGMVRVHLRVGLDETGQVSEQNYEQVDKEIPLKPRCEAGQAGVEVAATIQGVPPNPSAKLTALAIAAAPSPAPEPTLAPAIQVQDKNPAPGHYTEIQDPSQTTQPIDLETVEEVSANLTTAAPAPRSRIQTKVLEAAWFSQGDQLEEGEEEPIEVVPTPGQEDLERHARELTTDQYRKFSLDLSPPIPPPVTNEPAYAGKTNSVSTDQTAQLPSPPPLTGIQTIPTEVETIPRPDLHPPAMVPSPQATLDPGQRQREGLETVQPPGPSMSVAAALASKAPVVSQPPKETNLPSEGNQKPSSKGAAAPISLVAPLSVIPVTPPSVILVTPPSVIPVTPPSIIPVTPPSIIPLAPPSVIPVGPPSIVPVKSAPPPPSSPMDGLITVPGSMQAITPAMVAANLAHTDEVYANAPTPLIKRFAEELKRFYSRLIVNRFRTFIIGIFAGLLLAWIYSLVTSPSLEATSGTNRTAEASTDTSPTKQPRMVKSPRLQTSNTPKVIAAPPSPPGEETPAPPPASRSLSPREQHQINNYLGKARRAARKGQWRKTRLLAHKILQIQPAHETATKLLDLAAKKYHH